MYLHNLIFFKLIEGEKLNGHEHWRRTIFVGLYGYFSLQCNKTLNIVLVSGVRNQ